MKKIIFITGIIGLSLLWHACKTTSTTATKKADHNPGKGLTQEQRIQNTALFVDGVREKQLGNYEKASGLFGQCYLQNPKNDAALYELAMIQYREKKFDDALVYIKKAVQINPGNKWYDLLQARVYIGKNDFSAAAKAYEKLYKKTPESLELLFEWADIYLQNEDYDGAIAIYDKIEKRQGVKPEISIQKEKIYFKQGKPDKAINEIQMLVEQFPNETQYKGLLADAYMMANKPEKAFEMYQQIIKSNPDDPYAHLSLAEYYSNINQPAKAIDELKIAMSSPNLDIDSKVKVLLSMLDMGSRVKEYKNALADLGKIVTESAPFEPKAFSVYGDILSSEYKFEEAREAFRKVITLDSSKYVVWQQLILLDYQLSDMSSLLIDTEKTINLFPEQVEPYYYHGLAQIYAANWQKAIKAFNNAKNLIVNDNTLLLKIYTNLGDCYYQTASFDLCFESYEKALKIDSYDLYVLNNYSYFLAVLNTNLKRAEELAERLVSKNSDDFHYLDTYAWVLFRKKDFEKAKIWIDKAYKAKGGDNATIIEHYGDILFMLGDVGAALEKWNKALILDSRSPLLKKKINDKKYYE